MDSKLSISVILTIGVFVFTVYLFVVVVMVQDEVTSSVTDSNTVTATTTPRVEQQEIKHSGKKIFDANCKACHRIHQKLVGPALAGVLDRRDSLWVVKMIRNSSQLIASGDPTAVKLFNEYSKTQMTSFTSFSDEELRNLLEYLRLETEQQEPLPSPSKAEV